MPRARGLVFLLIGAACAYAHGLPRLSVYENGIGAINLPFRAAEVGLDHSRSVHPLSLRRVGDFVSQLLGMPFDITNPFLFTTKAQMMAGLGRDRTAELVRSTVTCDRRHRGVVMQCGRCSSCLLRRQALVAGGIADPTRYIATVDTRAKRPIEHVHHRAMLQQVDWLQSCFMSEDPWRCMVARHPTLVDIVDSVSRGSLQDERMFVDQLLGLYRQYVDEWQRVRDVLAWELRKEARLPKAA